MVEGVMDDNPLPLHVRNVGRFELVEGFFGQKWLAPGSAVRISEELCHKMASSTVLYYVTAETEGTLLAVATNRSSSSSSSRTLLPILTGASLPLPMYALTVHGEMRRTSAASPTLNKCCIILLSVYKTTQTSVL